MWAVLGANGPLRPLGQRAANVGYEGRAKTFNNWLGFERGFW
jgi:hypothetical protein